jgi:hypothetical protein
MNIRIWMYEYDAWMYMNVHEYGWYANSFEWFHWEVFDNDWWVR